MRSLSNCFTSWAFISCFLLCLVSSNREFKIDYDNDCFLKDGKPFRYVSGSLHYFRVPWQFWADRLSKMKAAGLNAVQTYVEWNHHEPEPGSYNFEGNYDIVKFLQTAQDLDMVVILRTGPYIDAERDMGGLPYWLLRIDPNMKLRTYDTNYIKYLDQWYSVLLPKLRPLLYNNGGPIITIQVENEYGSLGICDAQYTTHLRDLFRHYLGDFVVLFTTDGSASNLVRCGKTDDVFSTVDFGTGADVKSIFNMLRWHQSSGPFVNSEFYSGWLDHWGEPHASVSEDAITKTLTDILTANASVNIYMFHGGTSFGFSAGSNIASTFQACPTSYDYDAPLTEAGDPTSKYYKIRDTIGKFMPLPPGPVPKPAPKMTVKPVVMKKAADIFDISYHDIVSPYPLSFEDIKQPYGFVIYTATVNFTTFDPVLLNVPDIRDRGYVFVNKKLQGILSREQKIYSMPLKVLKGQNISILVENQGRVCFGSGINDIKGIVQNVTLDKQMLVNWTMSPLKLYSDSVKVLETMAFTRENAMWPHVTESSSFVPAFYTGVFSLDVDQPLDTFLKLDGWHKGVAFLNGFNLGRYWPIVGPQITLYAPSFLFNAPPGVNTISVLELEHAPCKTTSQCVVQFVDTPIVNGTTPLVQRISPYFQKPAELSTHRN